MKKISEENIGDQVFCDYCGTEFLSDNHTSGGFYFSGHAVCPFCADKQLKSIKQYNEEHFITAWCPKNMSFRNWVIKVLRGGKPGTRATYELSPGESIKEALDKLKWINNES